MNFREQALEREKRELEARIEKLESEASGGTGTAGRESELEEAKITAEERASDLEEREAALEEARDAASEADEAAAAAAEEKASASATLSKRPPGFRRWKRFSRKRGLRGSLKPGPPRTVFPATKRFWMARRLKPAGQKRSKPRSQAVFPRTSQIILIPPASLPRTRRPDGSRSRPVKGLRTPRRTGLGPLPQKCGVQVPQRRFLPPGSHASEPRSLLMTL